MSDATIGLRLTVDDESAEPDTARGVDVLAHVPHAAFGSDLAEALSSAFGSSAMDGGSWVHRRTRRTLSARQRVADLDLRWGDELRWSVTPDPVGESPAGGAPTCGAPTCEVIVTDGPNRGQRATLGAGGLVVGRTIGGLQLPEDLAVSDPHLRIDISGLLEEVTDVSVRDLDSRFGTFVDDVAVVESSWVFADRMGPAISVGDSVLRVIRGRGGVVLRRVPRVADPVVERQVTAPRAPELPMARRFPVAAALAPVMMGGAMIAMTGRMLGLVIVAVGPLIALWSFVDDRRVTRRTIRRTTAEFRHELERRALEAERLHALSVAQRHRSVRTIDECRADAAACVPTLWSRTASHSDFLEVSIGSADQPSLVTMTVPDGGEAQLLAESATTAAAFDVAPDVPVIIDLDAHRIVGIVGPTDRRRELARALVLQLSCAAGPSTLRFVGPETAEWEWLHWLPHARTPGGQRCRRVRVVDCADRTDINESPLESCSDRPDIVLWCVESREQLPDDTSAIVEVDSAGDRPSHATLTLVDTGAVIAGLTAWRCDRSDARLLAISLSPLIDDRVVDTDSDLPSVVDGSAVVPEHLATALADHWSRDPAGLPFVIGMDALGPRLADLAIIGPHGLVAGTTGSGKSALLRSWLASAAVLNSPARLNMILIDYKASAAFAELASLPHVVGVVTHLDHGETQRALLALNAELERRQRLLRDAGVEDIATLWAQRPQVELARLLVVIDEFRALKDSVPAFVDGVVDVAARGRNVGIHLIMATQRPEGAISADIQANTELRVSLRVSSANDAREVLGTADAADISAATPGRFIARLDGELVRLQACFVDGPDVCVRERTVIVTPLGGAPAVADWVDPSPETGPDGDCPVTTTRLIEAATSVWASSSRSPLHRPWLDPLPHVSVVPATLEWDGVAPSSSTGGRSDLAVHLGEVDDPAQQRRIPWVEDLATGGSTIVYGGPGAGVTTLLTVWITRLACRRSPSELHVFGIDAGGGDLGVLEELPQCGAVVQLADVSRLRRLLAVLTNELDRRFLSSTGSEPFIVLTVDGMGALQAVLADEDGGALREKFDRLIADGPRVGIVGLLGADRRSAVPSTIANAVPRTLVMSLANDEDLIWLGTRHLRGVDMAPGRVGLPSELMAHVAQLDGIAGRAGAPLWPVDGDPQETIGRVLGCCWKRNGCPSSGPDPVRPLAELVNTTTLFDLVDRAEPRPAHPGTMIPIGLDESGRPCGPDFDRSNTFVVIGPPTIGRTTALATLAQSFDRSWPMSDRYLVAGRRTRLEVLEGWTDSSRGDEAGRCLVDGVLSDLSRVCPDGEHGGFVGVTGDPTQAGRTPTLVVVDDLDEMLDGAVATLLDKLVRIGRDRSVWVAASLTSYRVSGSFQPIVRSLIGARHALVMSPDPLVDGDPLGLRLPRWSIGPQPRGRGHLVSTAGTLLIQVAGQGHPAGRD